MDKLGMSMLLFRARSTLGVKSLRRRRRINDPTFIVTGPNAVVRKPGLLCEIKTPPTIELNTGTKLSTDDTEEPCFYYTILSSSDYCLFDIELP
ncbi:hypothetical protein RvY_12176 [Ramazzottius varieornatus]|uniref:Uncharacterized protein n=1 Tax=Ramazzottius varieornatus TaxID=947166 RepID=A0A1D1VIK6_RAMVA|nr:hypothetical protein RvY_12176 [Ramazzottius varieornatus]